MRAKRLPCRLALYFISHHTLFMNKKNIHIAIVFTLTVALAFVWGCTKSEKAAKTSKVETVPALLARNAIIGPASELETINSKYYRLKTTLESDSTQVQARLELAELFMVEARISGEHGHYYPAALRMIEKVLSSNPDKDTKFQAMAYKASVLLSQHEFQQALEVGKELIAMNPYSAQAFGVLVDAYVELGNYDEAVKMSDKMISIRPDLRSYSRVSYLREIHGDVKGAMEAMKLAIAAGYPGYEETAWSRYTLGKLHETYGDLESATFQYQAILTERPNYPFAVAALAGIEAKKGNLTEAKKIYHQACDLIPEVGFFEDLAALYFEEGKKAQGDSLIALVLEMYADDEKHGHNMNLEYAGLHLNITGDLDKAAQYAGAEYARRPDNIDVNRLMAMIAYRKRDIAKAGEYLTIAQKTQSKHPELKCLSGLLMAKTGKAREGKKMIQEAFKSDPYQSHVLVDEAKTLLNPKEIVKS